MDQGKLYKSRAKQETGSQVTASTASVKPLILYTILLRDLAMQVSEISC